MGLIKDINDSPYKLYIIAAGGGHSFSEYFDISGASRSIARLLAIDLPYGKEVLNEVLGYEVTKFVDTDTARHMALEAYEKCTKSVAKEYAIGLAVTAKLATDDEREGCTHAIYVALHGYNATLLFELELHQGHSRYDEEQICKHVMYRLLDHYIFRNPLNIEIWNNDLVFRRNFIQKNRTTLKPEGRVKLLVSGSFNPFNYGHNEMFKLGFEVFGIEPWAEIATCNADKGYVDYIEIDERLKTIPYNVVLTECPTYVEKAEYFFEQDAILYFIIGSDTWNRLIDPKYGYNSSELYTKLHELNARFVVLNREGHEKIENDLLDKLVYKDHKNRPDTFNVPISSSLIRSGEAENKLENL